MSTPNPPGDGQQPPHGWQQGPPPQGWQQPQGPPQGWQQPQGAPQGWQQGPQGQQQYGPPPGWAPPGASPQGGGEPPRKRGRLRKLLLIVGAVLVSVVACTFAVSGGGSDPAPTAPGTAAPEPNADPSPAEDDLTGNAGETITMGEVAITSTPLVTGTSGYTETLCTTATIVNSGDEAVPFNPLYWKLQDPQGAARTATFTPGETGMSSGELAPGGTVTGDVCFEDTS